MMVRVSIFVALVVLGAAHAGLGDEPGAMPGASHFAQAGPADRSSDVYSPLDAAEDSYRYSEARRRAALDRQLEVLDRIRQGHAAAALPYLDVPALRGYPGAPLRALRGGYAPPLPYPWPSYGRVLPYYPRVQQPIGHEKIWTGPNSYIYRPLYPEPFQPAPVDSVPQPAPPGHLPAPQPHPAPPVEPSEVPRPPAPADVLEIPEPPDTPHLGPVEL